MEKLPKKVNEFDKLLKLEKIERQHLEVLSADDKAVFMEMLYLKLAKLEDNARERDKLVVKTIAILDNEIVWAHNHSKIAEAIEDHLYDYGTVPSATHIAAVCRLNRKTVSEHLKAFSSNEGRTGQKEVMHAMSQKIMGIVMKAALNGDLKAAKLYIETTKAPKGSDAGVSNQNNYIQINKTVINQQVIQQLKPEQLKLIEQIIAGGESKAE